MRVWYTLFRYKNLGSVGEKTDHQFNTLFLSNSVPSYSLGNLCLRVDILWGSWEYMLACMASNFALTLWKSWTKIQTKFGTFFEQNGQNSDFGELISDLKYREKWYQKTCLREFWNIQAWADIQTFPGATCCGLDWLWNLETIHVWYTLFSCKNLSSVGKKIITSSTPCFCSVLYRATL